MMWCKLQTKPMKDYCIKLVIRTLTAFISQTDNSEGVTSHEMYNRVLQIFASERGDGVLL